MESDKKKTDGTQDHSQEIDEPVSMYILFARMFSIIARRVEERLGDEGRELMAQSVQEFGEGRGKDIARRARQRGNENDLQNYLVNYDMERS
ncbi:MAG: L-2-amino-thiazoline-4-carboxylic acid hydrolase, partial [Clostridiales bacterium]|nr:L-2-amino-thiazoline-4-carboxylic acid hydrolase [Clostridiales bacterium]